jgi:hypothetical protein
MMPGGSTRRSANPYLWETPLQGSRRTPIVGPDRLARPFFLPLFTQVPSRGVLESWNEGEEPEPQ